MSDRMRFSRRACDRYFHLVDGGVSDNLGLRGVLDYLETKCG